MLSSSMHARARSSFLTSSQHTRLRHQHQQFQKRSLIRPGRRLLALVLAAAILWILFYAQTTSHDDSSERPLAAEVSAYKKSLSKLAAAVRNPHRLKSRQKQQEKRSDASNHRPYSPPVLARKAFQLVDPKYEIVVVRSSIQHQNTTWRDTDTAYGDSWIIQSVAWLRVTHGIRPEVGEIAAWCKVPQPGAKGKGTTAGDDAFTSTKARVTMLTVPPRDRHIGQNVLLIIECDAVPLLRTHLRHSPALPAPTLEQRDVFSLEKIQMDFAFLHDFGHGETSTSESQPLTLWYGAPGVDVQLDQPYKLPRVKTTACLTPAFYTAGQMPITRWVEWRLHMHKIGTQRVAWYGRTNEMKQFVDAYISLTGVQDTFTLAPSLGEVASDLDHPYHDQDAWYADCLLANRPTSEYIMVLDNDEFPTVNPDDLSHSPAEQWLAFLDSLPEERGMWEMARVPMSIKLELAGKHEAPGRVPIDPSRLVQEQFNCVNAPDNIVKSFYRSNTVMAVNQHTQVRMYPIGAEMATRQKVHTTMPFRGLKWDSHKEGTWPKLLHYRMFINKKENGCKDPSPVLGSKAHHKYMASLHAEVMEVTDKIQQMMTRTVS